MKFREGFVSNSSSSSFIIMGIKLQNTRSEECPNCGEEIVFVSNRHYSANGERQIGNLTVIKDHASQDLYLGQILQQVGEYGSSKLQESWINNIKTIKMKVKEELLQLNLDSDPEVLYIRIEG